MAAGKKRAIVIGTSVGLCEYEDGLYGSVLQEGRHRSGIAWKRH